MSTTTPTDEPRFAIVGDSNSAGLGRVARARSLPFLGGPIGNGRALDGDFFEMIDGDFVLREPSPRAPQVADLFRRGVPILSTIGFNTQRIAQELYQSHYLAHGLALTALSDAVLRAIVIDYKPGPWAFYRTAVDQGAPVYVVHSPQRFPDNWFALAMRLEGVFLELLQELGVGFVDVRPQTTDAAGRLLPQFYTERENDQTHANDAWADLVLDRFFELSGLVVGE